MYVLKMSVVACVGLWDLLVFSDRETASYKAVL